MKILISIFFSLLVFSVANAASLTNEIKIGTNSKTSQLEIRLAQKYKKTVQANIIIADATGNIVRSFDCVIVKGSNIIYMQDALNLDEGNYIVKMIVNKKTSTTNFVLFK